MKTEPTHYIYLVLCSDHTYYCGYTTDLDRRIKEHNESARKGAKYTRPRRPVELKYAEKFSTKSEALRREYQIKQLPQEAKRKLTENASLV